MEKTSIKKIECDNRENVHMIPALEIVANKAMIRPPIALTIHLLLNDTQEHAICLL